MSRRWLVAVSVVAHLSLLVGLFVSGVWRIEQLERGHERHVLPFPMSPPAPSGGVVAAKLPAFTPKMPAHGPRQPHPRPPDAPQPQTGDGESTGPGSGSGEVTAVGTCTENCGEAPPADPVCGNSSVEAGEQCDDGNALDGDGCSASCRTEVVRQKTALIAPTVLHGLRISGETQLHPDAITQNQMIHDGVNRVDGIVKLCIAADGAVASAKLLVSTRYDAYDATLLAAVRDWRYRPYLLNGTPVPACSTVRFVYTIR